MRVVGVDFGTTNIRIATWDSEQTTSPDPKLIGSQGTPAMPAVVALQKQANGGIIPILGGEAEGLRDEENVTALIPNIKRLAMVCDPYVGWHTKVREAHEDPQNHWWEWNPQERCIEAWGQKFPIWDLIKSLLTAAMKQAGVSGDYEWRAGCPVHTNWEYRTRLAETLSQVTGKKGGVSWVVEEPILFLIAARELAGIPDASYMVYDVGGGSFDCALVQFLGTNHRMLTYGADGHPLLGGLDIDEELAKSLNYGEQLRLLRLAKEDLTYSNPSVVTEGEDKVAFDLGDLLRVLKKRGFREKYASIFRDAYTSAKIQWNRGGDEDDPPLGELLKKEESGEVRFVWQSKWEDISRDVDKIILFGGPTKGPFFKEYLEELFGSDKVVTAQELDPGDYDLAITGVSIGACYSWEVDPDPSEYAAMYVNRLPVQIVLEDLKTGRKVKYEPYEPFTQPSTDPFIPLQPFESYVSKKFLKEDLDDPYSGGRYELTVAYPEAEGVVIERCLVDPHINTRLIGSELKLVIDRLGRVGVEQKSDRSSPKRYMVIENPPWQTPEQKRAIQILLEQEREYQKRERERLNRILYSNPWGWQEHSG